MSLPDRYDAWLTEALGRPLPAETRATCLACPMSVESGCGRPVEVASFHPRSKCCTYLPVLHNFLVGRILTDPDPGMAEGAESVRARLRAGVAVTPLGLGWPAWFDRAYDENQAEDFGRRVALRCPHYLDRDGGLCGVWRHRNGICSTWFCRHDRGRLGRAVWEAVEKALEVVEEGLVRHCLEVMGVEDELRARLTSSDAPEDTLDGDVPITEALRRRAWGRWFGREEAFYVGCAEAVEGMTWARVASLGGQRLRARLEELEDALVDLDQPRLPPWLRGGALTEVARDRAGVWAYGYRVYDVEPLDGALAARLVDLGPTPTEILERELGQARVRWLFDQGLLVRARPR